MAKSIKAAAPATVAATRDAKVGSLIGDAGKAAATMLQKCKEAAAIASAQLDPAKPIGARIDDVVALYADDFKAAGHNVRALFKDALTLHAAAQSVVVVRAKGKDDKMEDVPMPAADALKTSKHAMRDAASQVREQNGIGRTRTKKAAEKKPNTAPNAPAVTRTDVDQFSDWLDNLGEYFSDAVYHPRIVARLIELGYTVSKAAKGVKVNGKAAA